jgi:hypothetical protein
MEDRAIKEGLWLTAGAALLGFYAGGVGDAVLTGFVALICIGRGSRWLQLQQDELSAPNRHNDEW